MNKPIFLLIEATANPEFEFERQHYLQNAAPITARFGGTHVAGYSVEKVLEETLEETIEGEQSPDVFVVMSFPDRNKISALFCDDQYKALVPFRDKGFQHIRYSICNELV
ncbi:MAG: DUF1330 domain-containing protein [Pseudomonadales bacterium]|nr:DUF1330 domain-containing protein [Pseudomonadales bacterium]